MSAEVEMDRNPFERLRIEAAKVKLRRLEKREKQGPKRHLPFKVSTGSAADKISKKAALL